MSIHNSKILARHVPCTPEQRILTFNHGTRVTVRDLFGSMPVRVKYRALQGDKSSFGKEWDRLLYDLVSLMISWPGGVSVSIRESSSRQTLTLRTGSHSRTWLNDGCRLLHQASFCDNLDSSEWVSIGASAPILSIDGFVCREPVATKRVQFISLGIEPLSNESRCNVLFEEVNRVFADSAFGAVDTESDSDGGLKKPKMDGFTGKELKLKKGVDRWPMFFLKINATRSATDSSLDVEDILDDRRPTLALVTDLLKATFYEFLKKNHCRPKSVNLSVRDRGGRIPENKRPRGKAEEARTRSSTASSVVSSQREEPARKAQRLEASGSRSESPFDGWSRIKSGPTLPTFKESMRPSSRLQSLSLSSAADREDTQDATKFKQPEPSTAEPSQPQLYDRNGKLMRKPFEDIDPKQLRGSGLIQRATPQRTADEGSTRPPEESAKEDAIEWTNPATKLATLVDPRTGFVLPPKPLTLSKRATKQVTQTETSDRNILVGTSNTTPWVKDLVEKWKNPVFELTERPIPKLPDISDMLGIDIKAGGHHCDHGLSTVSLGSYHEASALGLRGRVSKDALRRAELVSQVDSKFILVKVPFNQVQDDRTETQTSTTSSCLVLVDQHAADERCRVEGLMKDYFARGTTKVGGNIWEAVTEVLPKPLVFELSRQDRDVLCRSQEHFAHWGICYDVETPGASRSLGSKMPKTKGIGPKAQVAVRSLPPAILERCRTEPRLLSDLIRTEAWKLNDEAGLAQQPRPRPVLPGGTEDGSPVWVSLFHGCPQGIIELINSRSCRSAIMFNDPLTREQCAELLWRLVQCAFPFQCAHGRPSMVPLVDLGGGISQMRNAPEQRGPSLGRAFKHWKRQKR